MAYPLYYRSYCECSSQFRRWPLPVELTMTLPFLLLGSAKEDTELGSEKS